MVVSCLKCILTLRQVQTCPRVSNTRVWPNQARENWASEKGPWFQLYSDCLFVSVCVPVCWCVCFPLSVSLWYTLNTFSPSVTSLNLILSSALSTWLLPASLPSLYQSLPLCIKLLCLPLQLRHLPRSSTPLDFHLIPSFPLNSSVHRPVVFPSLPSYVNLFPCLFLLFLSLSVLLFYLSLTTFFLPL